MTQLSDAAWPSQLGGELEAGATKVLTAPCQGFCNFLFGTATLVTVDDSWSARSGEILHDKPPFTHSYIYHDHHHHHHHHHDHALRLYVPSYQIISCQPISAHPLTHLLQEWGRLKRILDFRVQQFTLNQAVLNREKDVRLRLIQSIDDFCQRAQQAPLYVYVIWIVRLAP